MNGTYQYVKPHNGYKPGQTRVWPKPYGDDLVRLGVAKPADDTPRKSSAPKKRKGAAAKTPENPESKRDDSKSVETRGK